jgi:predicted TIM-barrel fold metal-dependent hydrolase
LKEVLKYRKIDSHEHVGLEGTIEEQIDIADRLGIGKLVVSKPISADSGSKATPEEFRKCNDSILDAMKRFPDRYMGLLFLNPVYGKESLEEIKRCIDNGMIGLKVYNQVKINDPLFYPIIEKFIDLKMIILMHAHCGLGVGGKRTKYGNIQPNASIPEDFAEAAGRYPEAMFQYAHTGGGGDWQYACKIIKDFPNIYVDTSGSNNEGTMIDYALRYLGEDRLLFGTDSSYYQGVGTILASKLNEVQKKKIFFENYNNILKRSGRNIS